MRLGTELIGYDGHARSDAGITLSGLRRGQHGSTAVRHDAAAPVGLLAQPLRPDAAYPYIADTGLLYNTLVARLLPAFNAGLTLFSYGDAHLLARGGYGLLGGNLVGERVVNALAATGQEEFVHGASVMSGYGWHRLSRYHAGETVAAAPSAAPQRWADQVYLRRNHISRPTLGPWAIADANGWRWVLAKAAAWDAGFDYYGAATDAARHDAALRREIRGWRNAQLAGAFDWPARFGMRQPADTFRLDKVQQRRALGPSWRLAEWTPVGAGGGTRGRSRSLAPQLRGAPLTNLAPDARVTVSGVLDRSYAGALAVDSATGVGAVAGAPGLTGSGEWALAGDAGEKWIELAWDTPQKVRGVWLFDRAQTGHNVTAGTLTLTRADNSTTDHTVSGLDPAGAPKVVDLPPQTLRKVRFTITASTGTAPGLAELVVLGPGRAYQAGTLASGAGVRGVPSAEAARVTDGVIGARADQYATLTGNHAVLDLGGQYYVNGLAVWHYFGDPRTYRDVVVEVASRADFTDASIVFNNDTDNSLGLGTGTDEEYRGAPRRQTGAVCPAAGALPAAVVERQHGERRQPPDRGGGVRRRQRQHGRRGGDGQPLRGPRPGQPHRPRPGHPGGRRGRRAVPPAGPGGHQNRQQPAGHAR